MIRSQKMQGVPAGWVDTQKLNDQIGNLLNDKTKQANLYAKFFNKLRMGSNVLINCMGDSMTYGLDAVTSAQATKTYPQRLKEVLNIVYNSVVSNQVEVINRGNSGDQTIDAYKRWTTSANSDITIIMFGINDYHYGTGIDDFIGYYRKLISRELEWNSAVVILTAPKVKNVDIGVDTYRNAVYALAHEYGIHVIDSELFMQNVDASYWSDGWHYNEKGYGYFGAKLAACFIGEGLHKPSIVTDGTTLLTRKTTDNCVYVGNVSYVNGSSITPSEIDGGTGIIAQMDAGSQIHYSVYTSSDTMSVIPLLYLGANCSVDIEINFGEQQPQHTFQPLVTERIDGWDATDKRPDSKITISTGPDATLFHMYSSSAHNLTITQKGWCTITVKPVTGSCTLSGLHFTNFANRDSKSRIKTLESTKRTEKQIMITPSMTSFDLKMSDLNNVFNQSAILNAEYFKEKPYKLVLYVWGSVINEYVFGMGNAGGTGGEFLTLYKSTQIPGYATTTDVKITSMVKDQPNDKLKFNLSAEHSNVLYGYTAVISLL